MTPASPAIAASMLLLPLAARTLPIGTAYAVSVGIGALGAALLGMLLFGEPRSLARLFFLALLIVAIVGLKLTSPREAAAPRTLEGAAPEQPGRR